MKLIMILTVAAFCISVACDVLMIAVNLRHLKNNKSKERSLTIHSNE